MSHKYHKWTDYEDQVLTELVQRHGTGNWSLIAKEMKLDYEIPRRNGKQCRERWFNQLHHSNQHRKWTQEEDQRLIQIQAILGTKWMQLSHHFPGRSDNNVKNHFYSIVRRGIRRMCRHANISTTSIHAYSIKPFVLSKIFMEGACPPDSLDLALAAPLPAHSPVTAQDYYEITQIITLFIFDNNEGSSVKPHKDKIKELLHKIMEINSHYHRDSSSELNSYSPESFSDSEKKELPKLEKKESIEVQSQEEMEEEFNPNGIFSHSQRKPDKRETISSLQVIPSFKDIQPQKQTIQELEIKFPSLSFLRRDSELSLNPHFSLSLEEHCPELQLFTTPRRSECDSLFSKYLQ